MADAVDPDGDLPIDGSLACALGIAAMSLWIRRPDMVGAIADNLDLALGRSHGMGAVRL